MKANTLFNRKIGIYARHSKEDDNSQTIRNQLEIMTSYVNSFNGNIAEQYFDDGLTGVFFDRPNYLRMINDIKIGKIDTVITKDLSRLGRNYIESGKVIEDFFPRYNVRYIAIGDAFDSFLDTGDFIPIKNIFNEWYVKDISTKTKAAKENAAKKGRFIGSNAPYGYKKSPENKHLLVPDDEYSKIVVEIFNLFLGGLSARGIADYLSTKNIPSPAARLNNKNKANVKLAWGSASIYSILKNRVYCGDMVQGKRKNVSYKSKIRITVPQENWIVVPNTHEAIIDKVIFENVNRLINQRYKAKKTCTGKVSLLAGICHCADCGSLLVYTSKNSEGYYKCSGYNNNGSTFCTPHLVHEKSLICELKEYCKRISNSDISLSETENIEKFYYNSVLLEIEHLKTIKLTTQKAIDKLEKSTFKSFVENENSNNLLITQRLLEKIEHKLLKLQKKLDFTQIQMNEYQAKLKSDNYKIELIINFILNNSFDEYNLSSIFKNIIVEQSVSSKNPIYKPVLNF